MEETRAPEFDRPTRDLVPHPLNARLYGPPSLDAAFLDSIRTHGIITPLVVSEYDNVIVSGHRRHAAALALGIERVPITHFLVLAESAAEAELVTEEHLIEANRQRSKTTEQKAREFARLKEIEAELARPRMLNGVHPPADPEANLPQGRAPQARDRAAAKVGMGARTAERAAEVVEVIDALETNGDAESAAALRKTLNAKSPHAAHAQARKAGHIATPAPPRPPVPTLPASLRLEVLDVETCWPLEDEMVQLFVTSPPYALDVAYERGDLALPEWEGFMMTWLSQAFCKASPGGRLALNVPLDVTKPKPRPTYAQAVWAARSAGWTHRFSIVWNEGNVTHSVGRGSPDSPASVHVIAPVEMVAVFGKLGLRYGRVGEREDLREVPWKRSSDRTPDLAHDEWLAWTNGLWTFPGESRAWEGHPAPFPEELPRRLIKLLSFPGDTVCDPFVGSGTTAVIAAELGREFVGFDISPAYIDSAKRRLAARGFA